jgi:hypothetical protein
MRDDRLHRRLVLRRERLDELTTDELGGLAGGAPPQPTSDCPDYTYYCITGPAICTPSRIICS